MAEYHKSIRTLPIWNFTQVLQTQDLKYLWKDEEGKEDLTKVWREIYNEYCKAAKVDNRHFKQIAKIEDLKLKHYKLKLLLVLVIDKSYEVREKAKQALKGYNYIFREGKRFKDEYERLKKQLGSLQTKIEIEKGKLPQEDKKEAVSLMKQAVSLENLFPGRDIDIYTLPVEKWIALWEIASEKIKARKTA